MKKTIRTISLLVLAQPAFAVMSYIGLETDSSAVLSGGSWSGGGAGVLQADVVPGTSSGGTTTPGNTGVLVSGFSGTGTLTINQFASGGRIGSDVTGTITTTLVGGTADLIVANSNNFDGGANNFNSIQWGNFAGVTSLQVTVDYSEILAGRTFATPNLGQAPILGAMDVISHGLGLTGADFQVTAEYSGLVSSSDGVNFVNGVAGYNPRVSNEFGSVSAGQTSFTGDSVGNPGGHWLMLKGYDVDGDGAYDADDSDKVYVDSVTFTITRDDGMAFASDTQFNLSLDGEQFANLANAIPEPSAALLASLAGGLLLVRRRS